MYKHCLATFSESKQRVRFVNAYFEFDTYLLQYLLLVLPIFSRVPAQTFGAASPIRGFHTLMYIHVFSHNSSFCSTFHTFLLGLQVRVLRTASGALGAASIGGPWTELRHMRFHIHGSGHINGAWKFETSGVDQNT